MNKLFLTVIAIFLFSCSQKLNNQAEPDNKLFSGFKAPPADCRPFVRWWWNGNNLQKEEIIRQLDILRDAGIGGVEINPIAMPEDAAVIGTEPLTWLSREWNEMLKFAAIETRKRGMIADLIVGSGWPFGGEFLNEEETIQRIIVNKIPCSGGQYFDESIETLYGKAVAALNRRQEAAKSYDVIFIRLVPNDINFISEISDLTEIFKKENKLNFKVPSGDYHLVYGILQRSNREVMHGAPGAAGPVMNHYEREITNAYLSRLNKISQDTGSPLSELIRALFCDSIELDGANWTDGFEDIFFDTYNYKLEPWFPFIFYNPYLGYPDENFPAEFADKLKRVRYDYNKLLVNTFLDNFTREFQDFCNRQKVLCRYQAYGTPFLMGMMEGNMIADIPESNNWIYSSDMDADEWTWNQTHGYMIWNLYAASGGHLTGKKIISNEAMTNTRGVFKTSLDEIKQHDDMNFITGMNHAVLHGYNYSPVQAGFPGWVRYGTYFSEQNTWWQYLSKWTDYNARLSYIFQNSKPEKSIAVLAPEADIWSNYGLTRVQYHTEPWYCYRLWESVSQAGSSCDYIGQNIICKGKKENGLLNFGPMSYKVILMCGVQSIEPETAQALLEFVGNGGKLVAIDTVPHRSLTFQNSARKDSIVKDMFENIRNNFPDNFFEIESPASEDELLSWTGDMLDRIKLQPDVIIDSPLKNVFQINSKEGESDIWFFVNSSRVKKANFKAIFPTGKKTPWIWNPENGTRFVFPYDKNKNELNMILNPLESLLLVFEPDLSGEPKKCMEDTGDNLNMVVKGPWEVTFKHVDGQTFNKTFEDLFDFGTSNDRQLNSFAGTAAYTARFKVDNQYNYLRIEKVNKGVAEIVLNGKEVGTNWYGTPVFYIKDAINKGDNELIIIYTTVLSNYVMSLKDNPTFSKWTSGYDKLPSGLEGNIVLTDSYY